MLTIILYNDYQRLDNGTLYLFRQQYIKEDELWECAYVDVWGNIAEVESGNLVSYDESLDQARKELVDLILDSGLKYCEDNEVVLWKNLDAETQRKIKVKASTLKMDLEGDWDTDENRYATWRNYMYSYCGIWFTKRQFDKM